jgi:hypothetical protein
VFIPRFAENTRITHNPPTIATTFLENAIMAHRPQIVPENKTAALEAAATGNILD